MRRSKDADAGKGAVEQDKRSQRTNTSLRGQLPHRTQNPLIKGRDSDFPESGENPEHSGQLRDQSLPRSRGEQKRRRNPEGRNQDQDPGRQERNQGTQ